MEMRTLFAPIGQALHSLLQRRNRRVQPGTTDPQAVCIQCRIQPGTTDPQVIRRRDRRIQPGTTDPQLIRVGQAPPHMRVSLHDTQVTGEAFPNRESSDIASRGSGKSPSSTQQRASLQAAERNQREAEDLVGLEAEIERLQKSEEKVIKNHWFMHVVAVLHTIMLNATPACTLFACSS